ncbi:hypothetical protein BGZ50_007888 [Haplosporangium sp. Z 11]|nr:hypothetical protein BGZ50_007888 [Haplosporangium sp. Z 11]
MDTSFLQQPPSNQVLEQINKEMQGLSSASSSIGVFLAEMNPSEQVQPAFQSQSHLSSQAPQQHHHRPSPSLSPSPSQPIPGSMHFNDAPLFGFKASSASVPSSSSATLNMSLQLQSAPDAFSSRMMTDSSSYYTTPQPHQQAILQPLAMLSREESSSIAFASHPPSPPFGPTSTLNSIMPGQDTNSMILDASVNKGEPSPASWVWDATYQPTHIGTGDPALQKHIHRQEMQQQHQMSLHNPHRIECTQESSFEDPQFHHKKEEFMSLPAPPTLSVQLADDSFWQSSGKSGTGDGLNPLGGSIPSVLFEPTLESTISTTSSLTSSSSAADSASTSLSASPRRSKSATNTGKIRRRSSKPIQAMLSSSHASAGSSSSSRARSYSIASTSASLSLPSSFSATTGTISTSLPGSGRAGVEIREPGYPFMNDTNEPNVMGIDMAASLSIGMNMSMSNLRSPLGDSTMERDFGTMDHSDDNTLFPSTMAVSAVTSQLEPSSLMDADALDFDLDTLLSNSTGFQSSSLAPSFPRSAASIPSPSAPTSSSPPTTPSSMACHPSTPSIVTNTENTSDMITTATVMMMTPTPTVKQILLPPLLPCPVSGCKKSFARSYNLNTHLKTQHNLNPQDPESTLSASSSPSSSTATAAATSSFSSSQPAPSSTTILAPVPVAQSSSATTEITNPTPAISPPRPFPCHLCPRVFSRKHDLQRHIRVHTGSKPYVCMNCQKAFARTDALCRHYKVEEACRTMAENLEADEGVRMLQQNHAQQTLQLEVKELQKAQKLRNQQQKQQMFQQNFHGSASMDFF